MNFKISPAWLFVAACLLYILWDLQCNKPKPCPCVDTDVVKVDTQKIIEQFIGSWKKPKPDTVYMPGAILWLEKPVKTPEPVYVEVEVPQKVDTPAILKDYYAVAVYNDSTVTQYGLVKVTDTVSQNRIQARRWTTHFTIPVVKETTQEKKQREFYAGFGFYGNQINLFSAAHFDLSYKNRRDQIIEASVLFDGGDKPRYGVTFKPRLFK